MILNSGETNVTIPSTFEIGDWHKKFDIVYFTGYSSGPDSGPVTPYIATQAESGHYYYSGNLAASGTTGNAPTKSVTNWTQDFFAQPSYGAKVSYNSDFYRTDFGDGYYNILSKSANALKVKFDVQFNKRSDQETKMIIHQLEDSFNKGSKPSGGYTGIYWTPFAPYNLRHEFYVEGFNHNYSYMDVNDVSTSFMSESKALTDWQNFYIPFYNTSGFWAEGNTYEKYDITYASGTDYTHITSGWYYYSGENATTSSSSNGPQDNNTQWTKDVFFWSLDKGLEITQEPRFYKQEHQNSFFIRAEDGLNKSLLDFNFALKGRSDKEAKSIVHFLEKHRGKDQFLFTPPYPYNIQKPFICPSWEHTCVFKDNNDISMRFLEQPIDYISQVITFLDLVTVDEYYE